MIRAWESVCGMAFASRVWGLAIVTYLWVFC